MKHKMDDKQIEIIENRFKACKERRKKYYENEPNAKRFYIKRKEKSDVEVLLYYPKQKTNKKMPVYVNMHGGAWLAGDATSMETFCQHLANELSAFVVNVNYTKVDVEPFPYAMEEIVDTVKYFIKYEKEYFIDVGKIAIGGFSAGGQLAATAAIKCKEEGIKLVGQALIYPCTELVIDEENPDNILNPFIHYLFPDGGNQHRYVSPLQASDQELENLCPAIMIICGFDELKPMGIAYAKRLIDVGIPVKIKEYPLAYHGFVEVNQPEYSPRKVGQTPDQKEYCADATNYLINELKVCFNETRL